MHKHIYIVNVEVLKGRCDIQETWGRICVTKGKRDSILPSLSSAVPKHCFKRWFFMGQWSKPPMMLSCFSPPARWGLLDFKIALRAFLRRLLLLLLASSPPCQLLIAVGTAGPQLPVPDPSGRRWTSTTISRYQWALLDLNRGPLESSGHRWTATGVHLKIDVRIYAKQNAR